MAPWRQNPLSPLKIFDNGPSFLPLTIVDDLTSRLGGTSVHNMWRVSLGGYFDVPAVRWLPTAFCRTFFPLPPSLSLQQWR